MKKDTENVLMLLGCLTLPIIMLIAVVWGGWVLSVVWNWFMPAIFGLPYLTVVEAMAVSLIVSWLAKATVPSKEGRDVWVAYGELIGTAILAPAFVLIVAYILKFFMG